MRPEQGASGSLALLRVSPERFVYAIGGRKRGGATALFSRLATSLGGATLTGALPSDADDSTVASACP